MSTTGGRSASSAPQSLARGGPAPPPTFNSIVAELGRSEVLSENPTGFAGGKRAGRTLVRYDLLS